MSIITVRQTRNPFRGANIEYVASCKVTLEANGDLNVKNIGIRKPKDMLIAIYDGNTFCLSDKQLIPALDVKKYTSETDEPILSVITTDDYLTASNRRMLAEEIKCLKGLFSRAWTWLASPLCPATSGSDESQTNKAQNIESYFSGLRSSILICLRRKDGGGYVKLEEDMVEKLERR